MGMNMNLAAMYNTPGGPSGEDLEKQAQAELFAKLAADNGIDLDKMDDAQIQTLWNGVFAKEAEDDKDKGDDKGDGGDKKPPPFAKKDGGDKKDDDKDKEAAAAAEFNQIQEQRQKLAEADYLGRAMAHAMVQELGSIGEAMNKEAKGIDAIQAAKNLGQFAKHHAGAAAKGGADKAKAFGKSLKEHASKHKGALGAGAAAGAATGAAAGAATGRKKEASALDELAAKRAMEKIAEANFDIDEAADKLEALFTLGVTESTKVASAENQEQALELRALELLEQVGYPITWQE
jgi:hypothetical protein